MYDSEKYGFVCSECGGHKLGHQQYVKCVIPVIIYEDSLMGFGQSEIDETDYINVDNGYICMDCKKFVTHCGSMVQIEDLLDYLRMDTEALRQEEKGYEAYLKAQASAQSQIEKEQASYYREIDLADEMDN